MDDKRDLLAGLNAEQQRAVLTTEGPVLVVAGPGSGKTRVLTHRIAHLIQNEVRPESILAVTFTNKSAREMKDRIARLIGEEQSHGLVMGTFHSLGVRFLRQNPGIVADRLGLLPNFLIYDDGDQNNLVKQAIVQGLNLDPKQVNPRRMLSRISAAKSLFVSPEEFDKTVAVYDDEIVARVYREYQRLLKKNNAVDFDDLLLLPLELFDAAPSVLERYQSQFQYLLVDEYQDTNRVQYIMVSALAEKHRNLFVVGDPDQSIYAWRQADIRNILDFEKDYPDATQIHLELNYRSTANIVGTADKLIRDNKERIDRDLRTENEVGSPVVIHELSDQHHEAQWVVSQIRRLKTTHNAREDQVAVMYRTTAQSRVLEEAFRVSDIPYRIVGGLRFYERKEVKDVLAVLRLLHNPADDLSMDRVIDNLPIGKSLGAKAMQLLRTWATLQRVNLLEAFVAMAAGNGPQLTGAANAAGVKVGHVFTELRKRSTTLTLVELFDAIVDLTGYQKAFDHQSEEEMQRWANVLELRSDLDKYDLIAPESALATYLEQVALVSDADDLDKNENGRVTLITLHSAKGLEFPIVFITGVEEGLLPVSRAVEAEYTNPAAVEEERRLFYVGITRAQRLLFITHAQGRAMYGRYQGAVPSRFLAALPKEHISVQGQRESRQSQQRESLREKYGQRQEAGVTRSSPMWTEPTRQVESVPARAVVRLDVGDRVFHSKFGEGVVAEINERRDDQEVAINFIRHGQKRLLASLANLEPLTD